MNSRLREGSVRRPMPTADDGQMILFFFPFVYHSLINLKWKNYAFLVVVAYFISYIGTNIYIMPISSFIIYTMYLSNKRFCNSVS